MNDLLLAALRRSPLLFGAIALAVVVSSVVALAMLTSHSYGVSVSSGSTRIELTPPTPR